MSVSNGNKKRLTRGEKMLLVAPLFVLVVLGAIQFGGVWRERWFPRTFSVEGAVSFVRFSPDSRVLAAAFHYENAARTWSHQLTLWDIESGAVLWTTPLNTFVGGLDFSPDSQMIAVGLPSSSSVPNSALDVFDTRTGSRLWRVSLPLNANAGLFSPDGKSVVTQGQTIRVLDAATGKLRRILPTQSKTPGQWLRFTRDGRAILLLQTPDTENAEAVGQVQIWDIQNGKKRRQFPSTQTLWAELPRGRDQAILLEKACDDSNRSSCGKLQIWNVENGRLLQTLPGQDNAFDYTKWRSTSRDGRFLFRMKIADDSATEKARSSTRVEMLDLKSGAIKWSQPTVNTPFFCRFAPNLKTVCSSEITRDDADDTTRGSGIVRLWNAQNGEELRTWRVASAYAPVDYSPDSRFLMFFDGGKISLWNTEHF